MAVKKKLKTLSQHFIFSLLDASCHGARSEYNACQTQLIQLYREAVAFRTNYAEFTSYRILYYTCTKVFRRGDAWLCLLFCFVNRLFFQSNEAANSCVLLLLSWTRVLAV